MTASFSPAARAVIVTAALVIIVAGMKLAAVLLAPLLLAVFIAVICFPLMTKLQQLGLPSGLAITLVLLLSIPLTIAVKLALDSKPETQNLGRLLGPV